jgi:hypothetical protein
MNDLHAKLAAKCKAILESDEPPSAAELTMIRQFLKDNNITGDPEDPANPLRPISDRLREHDDFDTVPTNLQ